MVRTLATAALFGLIGSIALAQNINATKPVACFELTEAAADLAQAGQTTVFVDDNAMTHKKSIIALLKNARTGAWTLVEYQDGMICVLGHGRVTEL
jgi:hypothetical protein